MQSGFKKARPRVGVSACLLGYSVRYDGSHKLETWIARELTKWVDVFSFCPEVAMGFSVPRPPVQLVRHSVSPEKIGLMGVESREDFTAQAELTSQELAKKASGLDGFVFKENSPSCGLEKVKVFSSKGRFLNHEGVGFFPAALIELHSQGVRSKVPGLTMPMVEERIFSVPELRQEFLDRVFAYHARKQFPSVGQ